MQYGEKMKVGEVVTIRVAPEDIMTAIDIVKMSELAREYNLSLAQVVKWAMRYAFDAVRATGAVPLREGFEYMEMIRPYVASKSKNFRAAKVKTTLNLERFEQSVSEVDHKIANPITQRLPEKHNDGTESEDGMVSAFPIPDHVRKLVPVSMQDIGVITRRMKAKDPNITNEERAKWLLYSPAHSVAHMYLTNDEIKEAEALIKSIWPEYPSVLDN